MELYILVTSILVQLAAVVLAGMIAWITVRRSWVLIACAVFLMALRRSTSFYQSIALDRSIDPLAESVALLISVLMLVGFLILFLRERDIIATSTKTAVRTAATSVQSPGGTAVLLGILIVLSVSVVAYLSYSMSRNALIRNISSANLSLAQALATVADSSDPSVTSSGRLRLIDDVWGTIQDPQERSYVCIVNSDGVVTLHTRHRSRQGQYAGDRLILDRIHGFSELMDLIRAKTDWVGWYTAALDERQIAAFAYSSTLSSLIGVHVPKAVVEKEILGSTLPLAAGLAVILATLLPAALGILYRAYNATLREVKENEARYRAVVEDQTELICRNLPDQTITFVNDAYCQCFGRSRDELIGQKFMPMIPEEDHRKVQEHFSSLGPGNQVATHEHRVIIHNGEVRWQRWTNRALLDDNFEVVEFQGTGRDVTKEVVLQAQLHQAQKMEAVAQLAGGVAHDFNNILTVIGGYVSLAHGALPNDHEAAASLRGIQEAADQAAGVTKSLLALTQKTDVRKEPIDLCASVEASLGLLRHVLPDGIEVVADTAGEPVWIHADRTQLQQIIMNLAINARDAMLGRGTLRISVSQSAQESATPGETQESVARLVISDTGTGITPDVRERIFEPFFTTKPRGQGTGLGLAIIYSIVQDHHGHISVESEPGRGAAFTVELPILEVDESMEAPEDKAPPKRGRGELVLLAEDNLHVRSILTSALESLDYEVVRAVDGSSLMDYFNRYRDRIDLLVIDVDLPKRDGLDCLREIRSRGGVAPVIVITGGVGEDLESRLDSDTTLLRKPFQVTEFTALVGETLAAQQSREQPT